MVGQGSRVAKSGLGRPRDPRVDAAILDAAVELLCEVGMASLTIDLLIERAGVSRSVLYRRWESKEDVVKAAVSSAFDTAVPTPDTGELRSDLIAELTSLVGMLTTTKLGRIFPALMAEASRDKEWAAMWGGVTRSRRAQALTIVERAIARGEIRKECDGDLLMDLVSGVVYTRLLIRQTKFSKSEVPAIVDAALRGLT